MFFKEFIKKIIKKLPLKYIIFESIPDLSDNTKAVFDEIIKRNNLKKYKFVWIVSDSRNVTYNYKKTIYVDFQRNGLKLLYCKLRAKCIIYCNTFIEKANNRTKVVYLTHATQIKDSSSYYRAPDDIDFCIITSNALKEEMSKVYSIKQEKMYPLGFPRNDILFNTSLDSKRFFKNRYSKIIVWYPTFRQSKGGRIVEGCECLPIIHNEEIAKRINSILQENNILIVLKPHFAQDLTYIKKMELSNILFIDDSFFVQKNISSYEFVGGCDALLTDYSSIYFDYLACNKPIGVIWEDIDNYRRNRGFCVNIDYYMKCAEKIYTEEDFIGFIKHISGNLDLQKELRTEIRNLVHDYQDGNNTKRVVDLIYKNIVF